MHSSNDDRVHSATLRDGSSYADARLRGVSRGLAAACSSSPKKGDFDECQIDKSGRWLVIKENLDGRNGEDNRIIDLETGAEHVLSDENGAAGHSDIGYGYMVAEDNFNAQPGAVRVWRFDMDLRGGQPATQQGQGTLVYQLSSWDSGLGHVAHGNSRAGRAARPADGVRQQRATGRRSPRVNEIVCFRLDGSLNALVVAPNMTDLNAVGRRQRRLLEDAEGQSRRHRRVLHLDGQRRLGPPRCVHRARADGESRRIGAIAVARAITVARADAGTDAGSDARTESGANAVTCAHRRRRGRRIRCDGPMASTCRRQAIRSRKTGGCGGCADAGASSEQRITSGDGGVFVTGHRPGAAAIRGLDLG